MRYEIIPVIIKRILPEFMELYESCGQSVFKTHGYSNYIYLRVDNMSWGIEIPITTEPFDLPDLIRKQANLFCCRILLGDK